MAVGPDSREDRNAPPVSRLDYVLGKLKTAKRDHPERGERRRRSVDDESVARKERPRRSMRHRDGGSLSYADEKNKVLGTSVNGDLTTKTASPESGGRRSSSFSATDSPLTETTRWRPPNRKDDFLSYADEKTEERMRSESEDPAAVGNRQVKRRHDIRIDPHDISNKTMVDGASPESPPPPRPPPPPPPPPPDDDAAKKEVELWRNAQFRAIKPSPSILSFVEENLLGRRSSIELKKAGYNVGLSAPLDNIPFSNITKRELIEENVFRSKLQLFASSNVSDSFPPPILTEVAFAGGSNVGKTSLLNALTRQWRVARVPDKRRLSKTINFYRLASQLCIADLPQYGCAYAGDEWTELVKEYVSTREGLERVCLLIETKWGMKSRDHELIDLMERSRTPYQIVLTKTDLVLPMDVAHRAMQIQEDLKARKSIVEPIMMVSSASGAGIRSLRAMLSKLARFVKP